MLAVHRVLVSVCNRTERDGGVVVVVVVVDVVDVVVVVVVDGGREGNE
jgi:hypothetical protein